MKKIILLSFVLLVARCAPAAKSAGSSPVPEETPSEKSLCPACSADAVTVVAGLTSQKFDCTTPSVSATRGFRCKGKINGYSQPVNIFIAPSLQRDREVTLAYHLHGFWTDPKQSPFDGADGDYGAFVAASQRNLVLIIPESRGQDTTYATDIGTARTMNTFFTNIENVLANAGLNLTLNTPRLLSGHSGAYVQMGKMGLWAKSAEVPFLKSLRGVGLFDTGYGYREGLVDLNDAQCRNSSAAYFMVYNPNDGSTGKKNTNIRIHGEILSSHKCAKAVVTSLQDPATAHVQFPRKYIARFFATSVVP